MKKRILSYRRHIDEILNQPAPDTDWEALLRTHLDQISFFQHERLVHLIVTVLVAILTLLCIGIAIIAAAPSMYLAALPLFVLLVPYISHYYLLENEVQKMYAQYDIMAEHVHGTSASQRAQGSM